MSTSPPLVVADRYRLIAPLGQGGMGRVWRATDVVLHREVAIKELVPPPGLTPDERREMRERSLREARAIARLNNVNVVRVFDVLRTDADPWIVMEYVPSRSLQDILAADGPFVPVRAAEIGLGVLNALRAAHRAGVVHRDVKPGNVLIGEDGRVVLTDFGLATVPGDPNVTRTGLVLGSPAYIAPERARDGTAGPGADLWSLGATLYAAVEGASPFARPSAIATLAALATENPPPARNAGPLKPVLNGLLRKDPAHRINAEEAERLLLRATGRRSKLSFPMSPTMRRPGVGRERPSAGLTPPVVPGVSASAPVVPGPRPPVSPARPPFSSARPPVSPARPPVGPAADGRPPIFVPGKASVGRPAADTPTRVDGPKPPELDATRIENRFGTATPSSPPPPATSGPTRGPAPDATMRGSGFAPGSFTADQVAAARQRATGRSAPPAPATPAPPAARPTTTEPKTPSPSTPQAAAAGSAVADRPAATPPRSTPVPATQVPPAPGPEPSGSAPAGSGTPGSVASGSASPGKTAAASAPAEPAPAGSAAVSGEEGATATRESAATPSEAGLLAATSADQPDATAPEAAPADQPDATGSQAEQAGVTGSEAVPTGRPGSVGSQAARAEQPDATGSEASPTGGTGTPTAEAASETTAASPADEAADAGVDEPQGARRSNGSRRSKSSRPSSTVVTPAAEAAALPADATDADATDAGASKPAVATSSETATAQAVAAAPEPTAQAGETTPTPAVGVGSSKAARRKSRARTAKAAAVAAAVDAATEPSTSDDSAPATPPAADDLTKDDLTKDDLSEDEPGKDEPGKDEPGTGEQEQDAVDAADLPGAAAVAESPGAESGDGADAQDDGGTPVAAGPRPDRTRVIKPVTGPDDTKPRSGTPKRPQKTAAERKAALTATRVGAVPVARAEADPVSGGASVSGVPGFSQPSRPAWQPMSLRTPSAGARGITVFGTTLTRRQTVIAIGVLVAVLLALVVLVPRAFGDDQDDQAGDGGRKAGVAPATSAAKPTTAATSAAPAAPAPTSARPSSPAPASSPAPGNVTLPKGWYIYQDDSGFSVPLANGTSIERRGSEVYFKKNNRLLIIDQTDQPQPDPVADWKDQEADRRGRVYRNYEKIKIEPVDYFVKAADWEFTYTTTSGNPQHAVKRGVITKTGKQAYGISWYTSPDDWQDGLKDLQLIYQGFKPRS